MNFFSESRQQFFRPLVSKHRALVVACLRAFYDRLYSPESSFQFHVERLELRDLFAQVIRDEAIVAQEEALQLEMDEPDTWDETDEYALASSIIRLLMKHGWLEEYLDRASMLNAYRFTRVGKSFAKTFIEQENRTIRTRQRNVRNTRNALMAFFDGGDPYDLADAHAHSLQIIEDLSDEIADLDDRKQRMLKSAASGGAIGEFLDYMENHFKPELAVKLAADSVERHRHTILDLLDKVRHWPEEQREAIDKQLRPLIPEAMYIAQGDSPVLILLTRIEQAIDTAYHNKLSELRATLSSFSRAATQLIKQQVAMRSGLKEHRISQVVARIGAASEAEQDQMLDRLAAQINITQIGLLDPGMLRLRRLTERAIVSTESQRYEPSLEERRTIAMQQAESTAFTVSPLHIRDYLLGMLRDGEELKLSSLKPSDPPAILGIMHAIEAASASLAVGGERLEIIPLNETFETPFMTADDFLIRKAS